MELMFGGSLTDWHLRLKSGSTIVVWADSYSEEADQFVFCTGVRASAEEREHGDFVVGWFRDPEVLMVTARIPCADVDDICSGPFGEDGE